MCVVAVLFLGGGQNRFQLATAAVATVFCRRRRRTLLDDRAYFLEKMLAAASTVVDCSRHMNPPPPPPIDGNSFAAGKRSVHLVLGKTEASGVGSSSLLQADRRQIPTFHSSIKSIDRRGWLPQSSSCGSSIDRSIVKVQQSAFGPLCCRQLLTGRHFYIYV
jgi:hypothetical protein